VRSSIHLYLSSFRTRQIFALLEASAEDKSLEGCVSRLLDACPYAGNHLIDLLIDRKMPLDVRKQAAKMIGSVGYLDALPALERLHSRLESRIYGQKAMPFAPEESDIEAELLPVIHEALNFLRAP
jgi:HEAT repeat protein